MFSESEKKIHDDLTERQSITGVYFTKVPKIPYITITVEYMGEKPVPHRLESVMTFRETMVAQDPVSVVKLFLNDIDSAKSGMG